MACFAIEYENGKGLESFFEKFQHKAELVPTLMASLYLHESNRAVFIINPIMIKLFYAGPILWAIAYIFGDFSLHYSMFLIGLIPFSTILFWLPRFYYVILRIGIYKTGYRGRIRYL